MTGTEYQGVGRFYCPACDISFMTSPRPEKCHECGTVLVNPKKEIERLKAIIESEELCFSFEIGANGECCHCKKGQPSPEAIRPEMGSGDGKAGEPNVEYPHIGPGGLMAWNTPHDEDPPCFSHFPAPNGLCEEQCALRDDCDIATCDREERERRERMERTNPVAYHYKLESGRLRGRLKQAREIMRRSSFDWGMSDLQALWGVISDQPAPNTPRLESQPVMPRRRRCSNCYYGLKRADRDGEDLCLHEQGCEGQKPRYKFWKPKEGGA